MINTVMDYQHHYDVLMLRACNRKLLGYAENHHILPKCMGGSDDLVNIAKLTTEEHYLAHQLLVKIYPGNYKLLQAILIMSGEGNLHRKCTNKLFGWIKRKIDAEREFSADTRKKMSLAAQNQTDAKKKQISDKLKGRVSPNKGKKLSEERKAEIRILRKEKLLPGPNLGKKFSNETKQKMSEAKLGVSKSPEHKKNMRISQLRRWEK